MAVVNTHNNIIIACSSACLDDAPSYTTRLAIPSSGPPILSTRRIHYLLLPQPRHYHPR